MKHPIYSFLSQLPKNSQHQTTRLKDFLPLNCQALVNSLSSLGIYRNMPNQETKYCKTSLAYLQWMKRWHTVSSSYMLQLLRTVHVLLDVISYTYTIYKGIYKSYDSTIYKFIHYLQFKTENEFMM